MSIDVKKVYGPTTYAAGRGRYVYHLTNSSGTNETGVVKVDISSLKAPTEGTTVSKVPTYTVVEAITWAVQGFKHVRLDWDHTTDDEIVTCSGEGQANWMPVGGNVDPKSAGSTGDIILTTNGATTGASYDITIWLRTKA